MEHLSVQVGGTCITLYSPSLMSDAFPLQLLYCITTAESVSVLHHMYQNYIHMYLSAGHSQMHFLTTAASVSVLHHIPDVTTHCSSLQCQWPAAVTPLVRITLLNEAFKILKYLSHTDNCNSMYFLKLPLFYGGENNWKTCPSIEY